MLEILRKRFLEHPGRHPDVSWEEVEELLAKHPEKRRVLARMEETGGEPDAVRMMDNSLAFCDWSKESPLGRRSVCYDMEALGKRKKNPPRDSVEHMAKEIGIELLSEEEYRYLQSLDAFDLKTSSWIQTPGDIRQQSGALFMERRYGHVFVFHNGADSYYSSRGFRGILR